MFGVEMIRVEWRQFGLARLELGRLDHVPKWRAVSQTHRSVVHPCCGFRSGIDPCVLVINVNHALLLYET